MEVEKVHKNIGNQGLEYCRSVGQPRRHYEVFEGAERGVEDGFLFISLQYPDQLIDSLQV